MEALETLDPHWFWLALGLALAGAEMLVPGFFLIWLAAAAIATGVLCWFIPIGVALQVVTFAVLSIVAVYAGKRYLQDNPIVEADPKMNRRGARLSGEVATVTEPIENGQGRVHLGDSEWLARGTDAGVGSKVRIIGTDGAVLLVEPVALLPEASEAPPAEA